MTYENLKGRKVLVTGSSSGVWCGNSGVGGHGCFVGVHYYQTP